MVLADVLLIVLGVLWGVWVGYLTYRLFALEDDVRRTQMVLVSIALETMDDDKKKKLKKELKKEHNKKGKK